MHLGCYLILRSSSVSASAGLVVVPRWARGPAVAVVVLLGSVSLLAVPVLGRFGAKADNTTLLDRPYGTGWQVLAGLVFAGATLAAVVRGAKGGTRDGGRPRR